MRPIVTGGILGSILLLTIGQQEMKVPQAGPLAPYVQTSENGAYVDWLNGHVGVLGKTMISKPISKNKVFYEQTKGAAEIQGHERLLPVIIDIPKDGKTLLGADQDLKTRIKEMVTNLAADEIERDTGPFFQVMLRTPLWGKDSLMRLVLGEPGPQRVVPEVTTAGVPAIPASPLDEGPTGLIIDARGLQSHVAALLPRIMDESGRLIHGVDSADPVAVRERGLVAYAVTPTGVNPLSGGLRQGDRPMMVKALSAAGVTHADLIIHQADADKVAAAAGAPDFLKQCRVIILMSPPPPQKPRVAPSLRVAPEPRPRVVDPNLN